MKVNIKGLFDLLERVTYSNEINSIYITLTEDKIVSRMNSSSCYTILDIKNEIFEGIKSTDEINICMADIKNFKKYLQFLESISQEDYFLVTVNNEKIIFRDSNKKSKVDLFLSDKEAVQNLIISSYNKESMFRPLFKMDLQDFIDDYLSVLKSAPGTDINFEYDGVEKFTISLIDSISDDIGNSIELDLPIEKFIDPDTEKFKIKFKKNVFKFLSVYELITEDGMFYLNIVDSDEIQGDYDFGVVYFTVGETEDTVDPEKEVYGNMSLA